MEWFRELVFGTGIAHSILLLALVIAVGAALAKIKVAGVSLGMTWILFVGIVASHFGLVLDPVVLGRASSLRSEKAASSSTASPC